MEGWRGRGAATGGRCLARQRGLRARPRGRVGGRQRSRVMSDGRPSDSASKHRAPAALLLPWASCVGLLHGPKLKTCSLETWATTRAMAWVALVLGSPLFTGSFSTMCLIFFQLILFKLFFVHKSFNFSAYFYCTLVFCKKRHFGN